MQQVVAPAADLGAVQQTAGQELVAYQRKWDEELESFKKLAGRLQAAALEPDTTQPGVEAASQQASQQQPHQQLPSPTSVDEGHMQANNHSDQLAAAMRKAEALLAKVHAAAVQALSSAGAADNRLLAKQLRLQRNQAFETAKALLNRAAAGT